MSDQPNPNQTTYSKLKPTLKTGDIIMFKGFAFPGPEISFLEDIQGLEPFTHSGFIVELPIDDKGTKDLFFWHAIPPDAIDQFGPDYYKKVQCDGCVMVTLDSVIDWVAKQNTPTKTEFLLIARKISAADGTRGITDAGQLDQLNSYSRQMAGRSFSSPVESGMATDYFKGVADELLHGKSSSDATFFCSKLTSSTFQHVGLLQADLITNSVLPGNFGSKAKVGKLEWQDGVTFGDDIYFQPD